MWTSQFINENHTPNYSFLYLLLHNTFFRRLHDGKRIDCYSLRLSLQSSVLLTDEMMDTSIFDMSIIDPTPTPYFIHYLNQWIELPPYGIYSVDLQNYQVNHYLYIQLDRWKHSYSRQLKETDLQSIV